MNNKNRKRGIKKSNQLNLSINREVTVESFIDFYLKTEKKYNISSDQLKGLNGLLNLGKEKVSIWGVEFNEQLICALVWLKDGNRITYLLPIANLEAKRLSLPTVLVDELIENCSCRNVILDMEGSMIEGVADFYRSFGAVDEGYYLFQEKFLLF